MNSMKSLLPDHSWVSNAKRILLLGIVVVSATSPLTTTMYALPVGTTARVSIASNGSEVTGDSLHPSLSADGQFVAFASDSRSLVAGDTNLHRDVFVHNIITGQTERVSVSSAGTEGDLDSDYPSISADGRYVAFQSYARNLVPGDTNDDILTQGSDIFVHDRVTGETERVSVDSAGNQANRNSIYPSISGDGCYVAFQSVADNLVLQDTNQTDDIFVHDCQTGITSRVSVASDGAQTEWHRPSTFPSISQNGRYVVFSSHAENLVGSDHNAYTDVFLRDRLLNNTQLVSVAWDGTTQGNRQSGLQSKAAISGDGRYVVFESYARNLVPDDSNGYHDIFIRDLWATINTTTRVSHSSAGAQSNGNSKAPAISANGRFIAYESTASNLVSNDTNRYTDIFLYDRVSEDTVRISVATDGSQSSSYYNAGNSYDPSLSSNGSVTAFYSYADNLVLGDTNFDDDVFVHGDIIPHAALIISGNAGAGGVELHYDDDGVKSVVSAADGSYSISVPYDWSGYVVPSKQDAAFTPPHRFYTDLQSNQTDQDFVISSPPIILVHGWQGAAFGGGYSCDEGIQPFTGSNSTLGSLPEWFQNAGYQVWIAHLETSPGYTDTLERNAKCLRDQIAVVAGDNPLPITMVAHSMGGLVSRAAIRYLDPEIKIKALYTLGSPHAGIPMDILLLILPTSPGLCLISPGTCQMSVSYTSLFFNRSNPNVDSNRVHYYFFGGSGGSGVSGNILGYYLRLFGQGPNDSLVGQYSALGWKYPAMETSPADWTNASPPDRYFTNEAHFPGWGSSYYGTPDGQTPSHSFECMIAIMHNKVPNTKYCQPAVESLSSLEAESADVANIASFTEIRNGHLSAGQSVSLPLLIDSTGRTDFFLNWNGGNGPVFELARPNGQIVNQAYAAAHPGEVTYKFSPGTSETAPSGVYSFVSGTPGTWQVKITASDAIDYKTFAILDSSLTLDAQTNAEVFSVGETVTITATLSEAGTGLGGAIVIASIASPDSVVDEISLVDQGNGTYTGNYTIPDAPGYLSIDVHASGTNAGQAFTRQTSLLVTIQSEELQLTGVYDDQPVDSNSDGIYEELSFTAQVDLESAGEYAASADLYAGNEFITQVGDFFDLAAGAQSITLVLDGDAIRASGLDGPYTIRNLKLVPLEIGIRAQSVEEAWTTADYEYTQFVDETSPTVSSITRAGPNPTSASSVDFTVTFSESVQSLDANDLSLKTSGVSGAAIVSVAGSGSTRTVTVNTGSGNGTIRLDLIDDDSIKDTADLTLGGIGPGNGNFDSGETYSIVKSAPKPSVPVLLTPRNGILVNTLKPTLDWKDSNPTISRYQIQVATNKAFTTLVVDDANLSTSSYAFVSDLLPGKLYYWRVKAFNVPGTASAWSKAWTFKTPLAQPTLLSPADTDSLPIDRPTLDWNPVDGASQYNLQVSASSKFSTLLLNATVNSTEYTPIKDLLQDKTIYWRVRAKSSTVTGRWSASWTFKTGNPPSVPLLLTPANNALVKSYTPLFHWSESKIPAGTVFKHYELQVDDNSDFSNPVIEMTATVSQFTPTTDLASNTKFYWRARAVNEVNGVDHTSGWSPVWSFRTVIASPTGLTVIPNGWKPTFEWDNGIGSGSIKNYTIQVATNATFTNLLLNSTTPNSFYEMTKDLPSGKILYWRVRVNGENGPSAWTTMQYTTP